MMWHTHSLVSTSHSESNKHRQSSAPASPAVYLIPECHPAISEQRLPETLLPVHFQPVEGQLQHQTYSVVLNFNTSPVGKRVCTADQSIVVAIRWACKVQQ